MSWYSKASLRDLPHYIEGKKRTMSLTTLQNGKTRPYTNINMVSRCNVAVTKSAILHSGSSFPRALVKSIEVSIRTTHPRVAVFVGEEKRPVPGLKVKDSVKHSEEVVVGGV